MEIELLTHSDAKTVDKIAQVEKRANLQSQIDFVADVTIKTYDVEFIFC